MGSLTVKILTPVSLSHFETPTTHLRQSVCAYILKDRIFIGPDEVLTACHLRRLRRCLKMSQSKQYTLSLSTSLNMIECQKDDTTQVLKTLHKPCQRC